MLSLFHVDILFLPFFFFRSHENVTLIGLIIKQRSHLIDWHVKSYKSIFESLADTCDLTVMNLSAFDAVLWISFISCYLNSCRLFMLRLFWNVNAFCHDFADVFGLKDIIGICGTSPAAFDDTVRYALVLVVFWNHSVVLVTARVCKFHHCWTDRVL